MRARYKSILWKGPASFQSLGEFDIGKEHLPFPYLGTSAGKLEENEHNPTPLLIMDFSLQYFLNHNVKDCILPLTVIIFHLPVRFKICLKFLVAVSRFLGPDLTFGHQQEVKAHQD